MNHPAFSAAREIAAPNPTYAPTLSLKEIVMPVAADVARIDDIFRESTNLEYPVLRHAVEAIIAAGGKRLRPSILFMAAKFHHYDPEILLPMSAALELLHTASLVHDDTIDQALIRRGLPTLNSLIDEGTTVLVGDYLFAKSAVLSTMSGKQRATRIFAESLVTICEGEIAQKLAMHDISFSLERYYSRIYSKTAVLFAAAGEIGGVLSDAPEDAVQNLRHYGRQLGMAFQIVDDLLDVQATAQQLGKPVGGDIRQGTITLPTMFYLESAGAEARDAVRKVIEGEDRSDKHVNHVIAMINASDALEQAYNVAEGFAAEAKASLAGLPDVPIKRSLIDLAGFVVSRRF
ncbi:MAG: polyprenyl synthetase family protein [Chloroflexota bacterium]|nr:polyprenyl synthetase family protein [Chloroflexota bacterium]